MKFGVVVFPGSNCDRDMLESIEKDLEKEVMPLWHKNSGLGGLTVNDCIVLPGGFSFGDYLRCGAIARFSPIMQSVIQFAENGGKVLGVCNGFQILCESGLLPGALLRNQNQQFICKNTFIKSEASGKILQIPVAHGEGRYFATDDVLQQLNEKGQVLYRYCSSKGELTDDSNANGSVQNIAGIRNEAGNVFGMMPHPERATNSLLGNTDGLVVFQELFQLELV